MKASLFALLSLCALSVSAQPECAPGFSPACDPPTATTETQYSSTLRCHYPAFDLHVEIRAARPFDLTDPDRDAQCLRVRDVVEMEVLW